MITEMKFCPGSAGEPVENGKFLCLVCGRHISKRGYTRYLAKHNGPADRIDAFWAARAEQDRAYREAQEADNARARSIINALTDLGLDASGTNADIALPFETVEKLIAIAKRGIH